jgi:cellobiose-specific phosphotransferase system component IIC
MPELSALAHAFCVWCSNSFFGHGVRSSVWLFPAIEIIHLLALGVLGGAILIINLRLLGFRFRDEPVSNLARELQPWMTVSLAIMLVSGFFLFSSEAEKLYGNWAFRAKMISLALAILFTFTFYRKVTLSEEKQMSPIWSKAAAVFSLMLWAGVGLAGRAIGYV